MVFGNFSSTVLPTDHGVHTIHVLPQFVELGEKNGTVVGTLLEHYAMEPVNRTGTVFYVHNTNLYEDLFLPASRQQLNVSQKILERLTQTGEGVLLYINQLELTTFKRAQTDLSDTNKYKSVDLHTIIERFANHLEMRGHPEVIPTRERETSIPSHMGRIDIHRLDEVIDIFVPPFTRNFLFPKDVPSDAIYRKPLSHFALVDSVQHVCDYEYPPFVRFHSSCATGDINAAHTCDCGVQFRIAMREVVRNGWSIVYDDAEARAAYSLAAKMGFYAHSIRTGRDTYDAMKDFKYAVDPDGYGPDLRRYLGSVRLLKSTGVHEVILGTNNMHKKMRLEQAGIQIAGTTRVLSDNLPPEREKYLRVKKIKGGHDIPQFSGS